MVDGGVAIATGRLAAGMTRRGHDVTVLTTSAAPPRIIPSSHGTGETGDRLPRCVGASTRIGSTQRALQSDLPPSSAETIRYHLGVFYLSERIFSDSSRGSA